MLKVIWIKVRKRVPGYKEGDSFGEGVRLHNKLFLSDPQALNRRKYFGG